MNKEEVVRQALGKRQIYSVAKAAITEQKKIQEQQPLLERSTHDIQAGVHFLAQPPSISLRSVSQAVVKGCKIKEMKHKAVDGLLALSQRKRLELKLVEIVGESLEHPGTFTQGGPDPFWENLFVQRLEGLAEEAKTMRHKHPGEDGLAEFIEEVEVVITAIGRNIRTRTMMQTLLHGLGEMKGQVIKSAVDAEVLWHKLLGAKDAIHESEVSSRELVRALTKLKLGSQTHSASQEVSRRSTAGDAPAEGAEVEGLIAGLTKSFKRDVTKALDGTEHGETEAVYRLIQSGVENGNAKKMVEALQERRLTDVIDDAISGFLEYDQSNMLTLQSVAEEVQVEIEEQYPEFRERRQSLLQGKHDLDDAARPSLNNERWTRKRYSSRASGLVAKEVHAASAAHVAGQAPQAQQGRAARQRGTLLECLQDGDGREVAFGTVECEAPGVASDEGAHPSSDSDASDTSLTEFGAYAQKKRRSKRRSTARKSKLQAGGQEVIESFNTLLSAEQEGNGDLNVQKPVVPGRTLVVVLQGGQAAQPSEMVFGGADAAAQRRQPPASRGIWAAAKFIMHSAALQSSKQKHGGQEQEQEQDHEQPHPQAAPSTPSVGGVVQRRTKPTKAARAAPMKMRATLERREGQEDVLLPQLPSAKANMARSGPAKGGSKVHTGRARLTQGAVFGFPPEADHAAHAGPVTRLNHRHTGVSITAEGAHGPGLRRADSRALEERPGQQRVTLVDPPSGDAETAETGVTGTSSSSTAPAPTSGPEATAESSQEESELPRSARLRSKARTAKKAQGMTLRKKPTKSNLGQLESQRSSSNSAGPAAGGNDEERPVLPHLAHGNEDMAAIAEEAGDGPAQQQRVGFLAFNLDLANAIASLADGVQQQEGDLAKDEEEEEDEEEGDTTEDSEEEEESDLDEAGGDATDVAAGGSAAAGGIAVVAAAARADGVGDIGGADASCGVGAVGVGGVASGAEGGAALGGVVGASVHGAAVLAAAGHNAGGVTGTGADGVGGASNLLCVASDGAGIRYSVPSIAGGDTSSRASVLSLGSARMSVSSLASEGSVARSLAAEAVARPRCSRAMDAEEVVRRSLLHYGGVKALAMFTDVPEEAGDAGSDGPSAALGANGLQGVPRASILGRAGAASIGFITFDSPEAAQSALEGGLPGLSEAGLVATVMLADNLEVTPEGDEQGEQGSSESDSEDSSDSDSISEEDSADEHGEGRQVLRPTPADLEPALEELRKKVVSRFGSVEAAVEDLGASASDAESESEAARKVPVAVLHSALAEAGYVRSCPEVVILFRALGIGCEESSAISPEDFLRLAEPSRWLVPTTSTLASNMGTLLGALRLRRILLESLDGPQVLLAQVHTYLIGATRTDVEDTGPACLNLLGALRRCNVALRKLGSEEYAKALLSSAGLRVLTKAIGSRRLEVPTRKVAASVLSRALEVHGGPAFSAQQAEEAIVGSPGRAFDGEGAAETEEDVGVDSLLGAGETPIGDRLRRARPAREAAEPQAQLEARLVSELWRPLLVSFDPDPGSDTCPPPIDGQLLRQILALFLQAHLPQSVAGIRDRKLAPQVIAALCWLHEGKAQAIQYLEYLELLERSYPDEGVTALAASLGGCRLLWEQLVRLLRKKEEVDLRKRGRSLLKEWHKARERLCSRRWQAHRKRSRDLAQLHALARAVTKAESEGFETPWPPLAPLRSGATSRTQRKGASSVQSQQLAKSPEAASSPSRRGAGTDVDEASLFEEPESAGIEHFIMDRLKRRQELNPRKVPRLEMATPSPGRPGPGSARLPGVDRLPALPVLSQSARGRNPGDRPRVPLVFVEDHVPFTRSWKASPVPAAGQAKGARLPQIAKSQPMGGALAPGGVLPERAWAQAC